MNSSRALIYIFLFLYFRVNDLNRMEDLSLKICQSAFFDSPESANIAFSAPHLFAELRFDLSALTIDDIPKIILPEKLIFTCRKGNLSTESRLEAYSLAIDREVDYIDIDFEDDMDLLEALHFKIINSNTQLILSQHNYKTTPKFEALKKSTQIAFDLGADVAKIVTTAKSVSDLKHLYLLYSHFDNLIAFAMGKAGMESRAKILHLGAPFTYASFSDVKTASGQLNFQETVELYYQLKK